LFEGVGDEHPSIVTVPVVLWHPCRNFGRIAAS
jgi:hypothetical protein